MYVRYHVVHRKNNAPNCGNSTGASDHNVIGGNIMVSAHDTQTRPKNRVFLFLAVSRANLQDKPHRESITAPDEATARRMLVGRYVLSFAGSLPVAGGADNA